MSCLPVPLWVLKSEDLESQARPLLTNWWPWEFTKDLPTSFLICEVVAFLTVSFSLWDYVVFRIL